jgi:TPR repeat protein
VPRDYIKAREWFEKAAAQGHAGAQNNLGALYEFGHGVKQDSVRDIHVVKRRGRHLDE